MYLEKKHQVAVKWVMKLMRGTANVDLTSKKRQAQTRITGYVNLDFGGDLYGRKSLTGYTFSFAGYAITQKA